MTVVTTMMVKRNGMVYGILITVAVKDNGTAKVSDWTIAQKLGKEETRAKEESTRPSKEIQGT
jgi:hypothetical protein